MKQTAVEWFSQELDKRHCVILNYPEYQKLLEQAKAMEKQQIGKAFFEGRLKEIGSGVLFDMQPLIETFDNYYNETYKSE